MLCNLKQDPWIPWTKHTLDSEDKDTSPVHSIQIVYGNLYGVAKRLSFP